jgi:hypothetical protein
MMEKIVRKLYVANGIRHDTCLQMTPLGHPGGI